MREATVDEVSLGETSRVLSIAQVELRETLGSGAFGVVLRGHHRVLDAPVAVKVLAAGTAPHAMEALLREARVMARVDHPNVLRIFDAGTSEGQAYLVLEFMDGGSLEGVRLSAPELLRAGRQLLSGLQALHEVGIVHRDIKPANVLLRRSDSRLKLADLGIAMESAVHRTSSIVGTLAYMAPELLYQQPPAYGARSDLYALGMTLAELALGKPVCPATDLASLLVWARGGERPALARECPELPAVVVSLLSKMMDPRMEQRPASAAEVLAEWPSEVEVKESTRTDATAAVPGRKIGAWIVGDELYRSEAWRYYAVTHRKSGTSARLAQLDSSFFFARSRSSQEVWGDVLTGGVALAWSVDHPGLVPWLDWGTFGRLPYFVYKSVGRSVRGLVESAGAFDELLAVELGIGLCSAVAALHEAGIVHQMVRPDVVLSRLDGKGCWLGWPVHCVRAGSADKHASGIDLRPLNLSAAAPETYTGSSTIETSVDCYGLGYVLYWMLAGRDPDEGTTLGERLQARTRGTIPLRQSAPEVSAPTCSLVDALLSIDPTKRPSAGGAEQHLHQILSRWR